jgi:hypothetical protein
MSVRDLRESILAFAICTLTVSACSKPADTAADDLRNNSLAGDKPAAAGAVGVTVGAADAAAGQDTTRGSVKSADASPEAEAKGLPFQDGVYVVDGKCSKQGNFDDYAELGKKAHELVLHGPGAIKIENVTELGPGRYRATEAVTTEEGGKDRPYTVEFVQLTPTSFTRSASFGKVTLQLCPPDQVPPEWYKEMR